MTLARDLPCVVLAVDPGATSGWAVMYKSRMVPGALVSQVGTASSWHDRSHVVEQANSLSRERWDDAPGLPLIVVAETWPGLRGTALAGLGAQWGKWLAELERLDVPEKHIVRVDTGTWRKEVLGITRKSREVSKRAAQLRARAVLGRDVEHDAAEALCLGLWALRAEKVAKAIGKRELRRLGWSEVLG